MTDRYSGFVVHLDEILRDDDAADVISAIKMIKGVMTITPVTADFDADVIAVKRRDEQWREEIIKMLRIMNELPASLRRKDGS